jgi:hypothetical protein
MTGKGDKTKKPQVRSDILPLPEGKADVVIGRTYEDSKPGFPQPVKAPEDAPNVLLILLDDIGFGQPGTFGGPVPTPTLDRLAKNGLRYNQFHTTALCSPLGTQRQRPARSTLSKATARPQDTPEVEVL